MKLIDRVAIVTGTSPNIGGGIAEALAAEGAAIIAADANAENANDCAKSIQANGGRALPITCNVTDEAQVAKAVAAAVETFGRVDILINNAAFFNKKGVLDMPYDEWLAQTGVILGGAFLFTKYVAQSMIERQTGGAIINIISTAGHQGEPGNVAYSTSKSGLLNFTRSTAMELAEHGVRVNSLTPTATDRMESFDRAERWGRSVERPKDDVMESYRVRAPMQKLPSPSDYGRAAVFLASDDARMITGTDLRVDAGAIAKYWPWDPSAKHQ
ncbi:MAG: SDR family oxidoreductase [Rhodobacteraceae bacterium]|nr:SDR family oxidoreductase [Paracoccaceae bacterium]